MNIHPAVAALIQSLDPQREYAITHDLVAREIIRTGDNRSGFVFYDKASNIEAGIAFGGDFIRLDTHDVRRLQAAVHNEHAWRQDTRKTIESLNEAANSAGQNTCGRSWVAEIELCPRCGQNGSAHHAANRAARLTDDDMAEIHEREGKGEGT
jgi:hypothetical protein